ncbi:sugar ABC transporter permease [Schaalia sp. ZJ405]|nr:sugar ABC transporter permease [Schaalia sp. ZJ405]
MGVVPYLFVAPYVILLVIYGIVPVVYAFLLSLSHPDGSFAFLDNFIQVVNDYRFLTSMKNVGIYVVIWLSSLLILVVLLALLTHQAFQHFSKIARFVYYIPGALAGAASTLVWMFMLDPSVSPVSSFLNSIGIESFAQSVGPDKLPWIFAVIAFWSGAGGWIIIMYGALNGIPHEVIEAARVDGAGMFTTATRIQVPMILKWIAYMLIMSFATGTQLFVEPQLLASATFGGVSESWSPNQLSLVYAFHYADFNSAAALNMILLIISLIVAIIVIRKIKLFEVE